MHPSAVSRSSAALGDWRARHRDDKGFPDTPNQMVNGCTMTPDGEQAPIEKDRAIQESAP